MNKLSQNLLAQGTSACVPFHGFTHSFRTDSSVPVPHYAGASAQGPGMYVAPHFSIFPSRLKHSLLCSLGRATLIRQYVDSFCGGVLLAHAELPDDAMPGTAYPRMLTIAQREQIVRNGLGGREPVVRATAEK